MNTNTETMYWMSNEDWYEVDEDFKYFFRIKPTAPQRAKDSYELWLKHQEPRYIEKDGELYKIGDF